MHKGRLEAFTDGVIAVIITIMVLEMKVPQGSDFAALAPTLPMFLTYLLSHQCCHLLEQPSPYAASQRAGRWTGFVGELVFIAAAGKHAQPRFWEFFVSNVRNPHMGRASRPRFSRPHRSAAERDMMEVIHHPHNSSAGG